MKTSWPALRRLATTSSLSSSFIWQPTVSMYGASGLGLPLSRTLAYASASR